MLGDNDAFVNGLMGPVGSGKSYGCCVRLGNIAMNQPVAPDGYRYSRMLVVRNTRPELLSTTINTWQRIYDPAACGPVVYSSPISQLIKLKPTDQAPGLHMEVLFLPLDRPADVRKTLSLEITAAWVNEAREVPFPIIDALTGRVGRYPEPEMGGGTHDGYIIMDTNPPPEDHWWPEKFGAEQDQRYPWRLRIQPPAVLEAEQLDVERFRSIEPGHAGIESPVAVRSADKWWIINPGAENLNKIPGGVRYYLKQISNKRLDYIRAYLQAKYTFVNEGEAVYPEYIDHIMGANPVPALDDRPLVGGLDLGLTPALTVLQRSIDGQVRIPGTLPMFGLGLERFCREGIKPYMAEKFRGRQLDILYFDPAGTARDPNYEYTAQDILNANGIRAVPAPTNKFGIRRDALALPMGRMIDGHPGFVVHEGERLLRKGLSGAYHFPQSTSYGTDVTIRTPVKDETSHVCESAQYAALGSGEFQAMTQRQHGAPEGAWSSPYESDFQIFN